MTQTARIRKFWRDPVASYPEPFDPWRGAGNCFFDQDRAERVCQWIEENCRHKSGQFADQPFTLEPWEKQIVGHLFGWQRPQEDGTCTRRFRTAFLYLPKKNGKTALTAAIGLILLVADNEQGAEVYSCSGDREQATLGFHAAQYFIESNPDLEPHIQIYEGYRSFYYAATGSYWKILSSEARTKHGPNVHGLMIDELHVFRDRELIDTLTAGVIARRQPLVVYTTTAALAGENPCNMELEYAQGVRDGRIEDPTYFPAIWEPAKRDEEEWRDIRTWKRLNPNFGVTVSKQFVEDQIRRVEHMPAEENKVKRLHLNIQTNRYEEWLKADHWNACPEATPMTDLAGEVCYMGLDLGAKHDITGAVIYWPATRDVYAEAWIAEKQADENELYAKWVKEGYLHKTPGTVTDYAFVEKRVAELVAQFGVKQIGYDPWNATQTITNLATNYGLEDRLMLYRQGPQSFNEPSKQLEALVMASKIRHGDNPVLSWMALNAGKRTDENDNIRPVKPKGQTHLKIDLLVALVMAMGLSISDQDDKGDGDYVFVL